MDLLWTPSPGAKGGVYDTTSSPRRRILERTLKIFGLYTQTHVLVSEDTFGNQDDGR